MPFYAPYHSSIRNGTGSVAVNADGSLSIAPATGTGVTVTSSAAAALAIGRLGATTPAFQVDASAAASVTGIKVTSAAAGAGVALSLIGGNAAEALSIDSKGSGYLLLQTNATGNVGIGTATPGAMLHVAVNSTVPVLIESSVVAGNNAYIGFKNAGTFHGYFGWTSIGSQGLAFINAAGGAINALISDTGNLGLGVSSPNQLLTLKSTGALGWDNGAGVADILLYRSSASVLDIAATSTNPALRVNQSVASAVTGIQLSSQVAGNGFYSAVIGGNANENWFIDAKGAGTITLNGTATGSILLNRNTTVTSSAALAFAVGRLGTTTPALQVDASVANSITGIKITAAATTGGVAVDAIGETNVALSLNGAGSGAVSINSTGTGVLNLGHSGGSIGLYAVAAVARATTAGVAGAFVANTSGIVNDTATWDLYTIGQVVRALRNIGILT